LKVSWKLPRANPPLWTKHNSNTNSLQLVIIFKTLWKLVILLLQWYWCGGKWRCTSSTLWFTKVFPCFSRTHSGFPPQRKFGLV
jgi:hypothetical protein